MYLQGLMEGVRDGSRTLVVCLGLLVVFAPVICRGKPAAKPEIVQRLEVTHIPLISWTKRASAREVISFASIRFRELENREKSRRGVSFISEFEGYPVARTWFGGEGVEFTVVLEHIASSFTLDVHVTSVGVVIKSPGVPAFPNSKAQTGTVYKTFTPVSD